MVDDDRWIAAKRLRLMKKRCKKFCRHTYGKARSALSAMILGAQDIIIIRKSKKNCNISKIVVAISHPDQWGFWEWPGQNTSVGVSPETFLLLQA
jgi:hypothetical protein